MVIGLRPDAGEHHEPAAGYLEWILKIAGYPGMTDGQKQADVDGFNPGSDDSRSRRILS